MAASSRRRAGKVTVRHADGRVEVREPGAFRPGAVKRARRKQQVDTAREKRAATTQHARLDEQLADRVEREV